NFSSIAPTAPKLPAICMPRAPATRWTSAWAAPALRSCSITARPRLGASLVRLRAGDLDDSRPLLDVLAQEAAELVGRHGHRDRASLRRRGRGRARRPPSHGGALPPWGRAPRVRTRRS